MKLIFLGTNGWFSTNAGNTSCALVESEKYYIIFDAGDGLYKLNKYIKKEKPVYLFLSHLHLDHIIGLHSLILFTNKSGLKIYLPKGTKKFLEKIIDHPYALPFKDMSLKVSVNELSEGCHKLPFEVECRKLQHVDMDFGYRILLEGKTIVYCSDTGVCDNSFVLSQNADVLIHECSNREGHSSGSWGHVNPKEAAELAKKANVKKLFFTHFSGRDYANKKDKKTAQKIAKKIFKNTISGEDGMVIDL